MFRTITSVQIGSVATYRWTATLTCGHTVPITDTVGRFYQSGQIRSTWCAQCSLRNEPEKENE